MHVHAYVQAAYFPRALWRLRGPVDLDFGLPTAAVSAPAAGSASFWPSVAGVLPFLPFFSVSLRPVSTSASWPLAAWVTSVPLPSLSLLMGASLSPWSASACWWTCSSTSRVLVARRSPPGAGSLA